MRLLGTRSPQSIEYFTLLEDVGASKGHSLQKKNTINRHSHIHRHHNVQFQTQRHFLKTMHMQPNKKNENLYKKKKTHL